MQKMDWLNTALRAATRRGRPLTGDMNQALRLAAGYGRAVDPFSQDLQDMAEDVRVSYTDISERLAALKARLEEGGSL